MRVLVVEDDRELADLLRRALTEQVYTVEIAADGEIAQHLVTRECYDLIILDLMLPKVDGVQVCQALRSAGKTTPVIMLTARDAVGDRILGLDAGADDYLAKPFSLAELLARIRALMRRVGQRLTETLRVGDLSLDPRTNFVQVGERKVVLTAKELALLRFFLERPNAIATRSEILERVWDSNYEGLSNVVDVYVNYLRNKLEAGGEPRRIVAVRGRGYVLKEPPDAT